jgi:ribose transport system substrate-binding protein
MRPDRLGIAALLCAVVGLGAGCGSSSTSTTSGSGTSSSADSAAAKAVADATAPISAYPGPTSGPKAVPNKRLLVISCGMASAGCARPSLGAQTAAKAIGWEVSICDGKFDPQTFNNCIDQAINQNADAMFLEGIDAGIVANSLRRARSKGLVAVSAEADNIPSADGVNAEIDGRWAKQGEILANLALATNGPKAATLVEVDPSYRNLRNLSAAAIAVLKQAGAPYETFEFSEKDLATTVGQRTVAAAQKNPNIKAVINFDDALLQVAPAVAAAGLRDRVQLLGFNAVAPQLIQNKQMLASMGQAQLWEGWGAVDNINRILAGQKPVDQNVPIRLFNQQNVGVISGNKAWSGDVDYQSEYRKIWGT